MSEPFIAEIKIFAGTYAPRDFAFCDGQLLPISQNTSLFALIGTTYGGDGRTTMALPNLQGRAPMHPGRGPGLSHRIPGQFGGEETVQLDLAQIPSHEHNPWKNATSNPTSIDPTGRLASKHKDGTTERTFKTDPNLDVAFSSSQLATAGGSQGHQNMQPYLVVNFIIALYGVFPLRN